MFGDLLRLAVIGAFWFGVIGTALAMFAGYVWLLWAIW